MPAHAGGGRGGPVRARLPAERWSCHATERCEEVVLSRKNDSPPEAPPAGASPAHTSRRDFLKKAGTAGVLLGSGSALLSACSTATGTGGGTQSSASKGTIKILLWSHFVPRYDTWYDPWAKKWGQQNGVNVVVDHINQADLPARTAAEFAAGAGHDMIEWLTPASAYEPSVHRPDRRGQAGGGQVRQPDQLLQAVELQPAHQQVLRLLPHLDARPGRLPEGAVDEGRPGRRPH